MNYEITQELYDEDIYIAFEELSVIRKCNNSEVEG